MLKLRRIHIQNVKSLLNNVSVIYAILFLFLFLGVYIRVCVCIYFCVHFFWCFFVALDATVFSLANKTMLLSLALSYSPTHTHTHTCSRSLPQTPHRT